MNGYSVREQRGWYVYDWANSAFFSTVVTLFYGPYITSVAKAAADARGFIHPFGVPVDTASLWSYLIAMSVFTQILVLPILGAVADYSTRKKHLLGVITYIGAGATAAMFFVDSGRYMLGGILFLIANLAAGAGVVVYNSFLPDIAPEDQRDSVSSKGFAVGYVGGGLLLVLNLALYSQRESLGLSEGSAVRISLLSAGLWWAAFAIVPMLLLRNRVPKHHLEPGESVLSSGFKQLMNTLKDMRNYPQTLTFLIAYLIYNDAIQAVISLAGQFAAEELKMPLDDLTKAILLVQFTAMPGAMLFNFIASKTSAKRAVSMTLVIWTLIVTAMYALVTTSGGFFVAAAIVALVLGGSQALSRSLYSLMIPKGREAEYFSLYEISDKGTSWLAPLIFGLVRQATQSYRTAILSLIVFFVVGLLVLMRVNVKRAAFEAGNEAPENA